MSKRPSVPAARADAPLPFSRPVPVRTLSRTGPHPFDLVPDAGEREAIARFLGVVGLRRLSFAGELVPVGDERWRIEGRLRAEVAQNCVVTLEPVVQPIEEKIARDYVPAPDYRPPAEIDFDPDAADEPDPFDGVIDPGQLALESLALVLDPYPRAPGLPPAEYRAAPPGVAPLADQDLKPFAKLAVLRDKMSNGEG